MAEYKEQHGTTRVGDFLRTLKDKGVELAPEILDLASNVPGLNSLKVIGNMIKKDVNINDVDTAKALDLINLDISDIQNARELQKVALNQSDLFSKRFIYYLSAFIIFSATAMGIMLFYVDVPEGNKRLIEMFADIYLFAGAIMVLQFFFGSSLGSKKKDKNLLLNKEKDFS